MIEIGILITGIVIGSCTTAYIRTRVAKKLLLKRGDALRKIKNHKWNVAGQNDAMIVTRIAIDGLEYK